MAALAVRFSPRPSSIERYKGLRSNARTLPTLGARRVRKAFFVQVCSEDCLDVVTVQRPANAAEPRREGSTGHLTPVDAALFETECRCLNGLINRPCLRT